MPAQSEYDRRMTKRVLWKLDCHILPPLALVCAPKQDPAWVLTDPRLSCG
jgi:hypothetical protein